jgi:acyl-CoA synthetase (AMP-forming)/AMP-acid ligase II
MRLAGEPFEPLDLTLPDVLDRAAHGAFIDGDDIVPYSEVAERSHELASWFVAEGVEPGDRVALLASNRAEFVVAHYAAARAGAIVVPLSTRATAAELHRVLAHAQCSLALVEEEFKGHRFLDTFASLRGQLPSLRHVEPLAGLDGLKAARDAEMPATSATEPTLLIYTSGTTGEPKGCLHAHRSYVSSASMTARLKALTPEDRIVATVPFFNAFGIVNCVLEGLISGASVVVQPAFAPAETLRLIEEHRVTVLLGTPTMWIRLLEHPDFSKRDLSSLRTGTMAGAPAPAEVVERWRELGCELILIYGLSEATSILANGRPTPGIEVEVTSDGELRARGYNQMLRYYKNEVATYERIRDGWIHTGDLAQIRDGDVRVLGRSDDMLIVGGFNIQPAEVEEALRMHEGVADAAVFGFPQGDLGEVPLAWVIRRPGASVDQAQLLADCRLRLASYKLPREITFVDEFPLTANGKVQRFRMRETMLARRDTT